MQPLPPWAERGQERLEAMCKGPGITAGDAGHLVEKPVTLLRNRPLCMFALKIKTHISLPQCRREITVEMHSDEDEYACPTAM